MRTVAARSQIASPKWKHMLRQTAKKLSVKTHADPAVASDMLAKVAKKLFATTHPAVASDKAVSLFRLAKGPLGVA